MPRFELPAPVVRLGLAGWLPQALCLLAVLQRGVWQWSAQAAACFYAALILSFLGGLWWMAALLAGVRKPGVYAVAVLPSLIALAALGILLYYIVVALERVFAGWAERAPG